MMIPDSEVPGVTSMQPIVMGLAEAARAVYSVTDRDELLGILSERLGDLLSPARGVLLLVEADDRLVSVAGGDHEDPLLADAAKRAIKTKRTWSSRDGEGTEKSTMVLASPVGGADHQAIGAIAALCEVDDAERQRLEASIEILAVVIGMAFERVDRQIEIATAAVRNAELRGQAERRARRMALLNEAGRALTEVMVPDVLLGKILRLAGDALSFSHCAILLVNADKGELVVRAAVGYGEIVGKRIPKGQGISSEVVETGKPILVSDVLRDDRYIPGMVGGRTEMVAPIIIDGVVVGTLDAESPGVAAYDDDDLELFAAFAAQAGTALRNARLLDRLEQRGARLAILHRVSQAISTVLDPDQVLDEVLRLARGALAFSRSAIVLVDHETQDLVVRAALGYGDVVGKRLPIEGSVTGTVVTTGESILIPDVTQDPRYIEGSVGAACEMAVPLRVRGEVIGVIDAESELIGAFTERDVELLGVFAVHAATAIHNARLFRRLEDTNHALRASLREMERLNRELETSAQQIRQNNIQLERQVRQLSALHRAGQAMTATLDLDQTLDAILKMTREIIDTSAATIKLLDEESQEMHTRAVNGNVPSQNSRIDVPLQVGDRLIGVFELGANEELGEEDYRLLETLASQAAVAIENARLFEDTQRTYYNTLRSLASVLEARDAYTSGHSERVARLSKTIAEQLELNPEEQQELFSAAMLHDIGKIGVRDDILLKPASLTEAEMDVIRRHPALGDTILGPLKFLGRVSTLVKHHHERWDGTGYPDKLKGGEIPLASRIVAVADCYDALTSDRPYRDSMSGDHAVDEIQRNAGSQFDPQVVEALVAALGSTS